MYKEDEILEEGICSTCKVGMYYVQLDQSDVVCPNIMSYKDGKCSFYEAILSEKNGGEKND